MRVEILTDPNMANRGAQMLRAMIDASPFNVVEREKYRGDCEILMVYGTGHPTRRAWWLEHIASGRPAVAWDLGYWNRDARTMRLTIGDDHPHALITPEDGARWDAEGIELRNVHKPSGHVVIVGMSRKATKIHLMPTQKWELHAARSAAKEFPDRRVVFRPKRPTDPALPGFPSMRGDLQEVLRGASLVICRHSNVAVDACMAGVPVRCEDGAAFALYRHGEQPTLAQRLEFLRSLAHWQYTPNEASQAWNYIRRRLSV